MGRRPQRTRLESTESARAEALSRREGAEDQRIQLASFYAEYRGPLPLPEHFEAYNRTLPGAADRILGMAEQHAAHRRAMESRGQWMPWSVAIAFLVSGSVLVGTGRVWIGGVTLALPLVEFGLVLLKQIVELARPREPLPAPPSPPAREGRAGAGADKSD